MTWLPPFRSAMRPWLTPGVAVALAAAARAGAQAPTKTEAKTDSQKPKQPIVSTVQIRLRPEAWDWFGADSGQYVFTGGYVRGGLTQQRTKWSWRVELSAPFLLGLPDDAVQPAPRGQLGFGASYWAANDSLRYPVGLFLRQANVRLGGAPAKGGWGLRLGRFEFNDGLEVLPTDTTLLWLTRERISQRIIGVFGFTDVGRTFDGVYGSFDRAGRNVTAIAVRPTAGVFDVNAWPSLDVTVGYASYTVPVQTKRMSADARVFAAYYHDGRDMTALVKADNRPVAARNADHDDISLVTLGGHWIEVAHAGIGDVDVLFWGAAQAGDWGTQSHGAAAAAAELGWQPRAKSLAGVRPWVRVGWYRASGDDDPTDSRHDTYFSMLPTPRPYARFPFYNLMNIEDTHASLILRPRPTIFARVDARQLRLSNGQDLWYVGGGPFESSSFGYVGRPSGGARQLAALFDGSVDWKFRPRWTATAYGALTNTGLVPRRIYPEGSNARYAYVELQYGR